MMSPHMSPSPRTLRPLTMPPEIVFEIVRESWSTMTMAKDWHARWDFFRSISLVSHIWKGVMVSVALRRVMIQTAREFARYRKLVIDHFGSDPDSKEVERVSPAAHDYFQRSDIYIVLTDWSCPGTTGFVYSTDYARIPCYIPTCKYIEVLVKELPSNDRYILPYRPLFQFLAQYDATTNVCISWTYQHINRYILPESTVHGVTYLRLHDYPRCVCHNSSPIPARPHKVDCFSFLLPTLFPDLRHLHITTPYILKNISTLHLVDRLTIEAPPVHYLSNVGYYSSLSGWNIVSAVSNGLLKRGRKDAPRKRIVVNAGPNEPYGWEQARKACSTHGVDLELCHVYPNPMGEGSVP